MESRSPSTRFDQQLKTFLRILESYKEDKPLTKFLPDFFRRNKQMGSTDRRMASQLLYNYFRLGKACSELPAEERLMIAEFLTSNSSNAFLEHFKPEFADKIHLSIGEKITFLEEIGIGFLLDDVFPFHHHLSKEVDKTEFIKSFFIQPDLFIRVYPGKTAWVSSKLEDAGISYQEEEERSLRLPNGTKLDQLFPDNKYFEIQDLSSQDACGFFRPQKYDYWWDCCAASGGKSINLFHQQPDIKLLVSDIRESVLENLDERFSNAGLNKYHKKVLDLTKDPQPFIHSYEFDGIIYDAPCTGSGTWDRSPEMISQFQEYRIKAFQNLQQSIVKNIVRYLKPGKPLIYITCSVFKAENEDMVDFLVKELKLKLEVQTILKGYDRKSDSMFVARLLKPAI
ncbi:RsmB/NOP family class I SAM-dependent RNA methyltransferase [Paradesertivirga mongoliensis]|uniref:RsmB/NOP family class I SAM-dependent RNA methyltransferase n=1 Tax=Paradesertivirga mongoliensis TaxID=2100740 RepID=A0ABW4ZLR9_9SPHI|nr:RsmB/NOP family class I SAM-dependent RNA methyltransferase [Pedobacter mongoliensis]